MTVGCLLRGYRKREPKPFVLPKLVNQGSHWKRAMSEGRESDRNHFGGGGGKTASGFTPF